MFPGSSMNDVTAIGGGLKDFLYDITKTMVVKSVTIGCVENYPNLSDVIYGCTLFLKVSE